MGKLSGINNKKNKSRVGDTISNANENHYRTNVTQGCGNEEVFAGKRKQGAGRTAPGYWNRCSSGDGYLK
jgi:hypothetical protein